MVLLERHSAPDAAGPARKSAWPAWIAFEFRVAFLQNVLFSVPKGYKNHFLSLRSTPLEIIVLLERHSAPDAAGPARKSDWAAWIAFEFRVAFLQNVLFSVPKGYK